MGKRKVIIDLKSLLSAFPIESYLELVSASWIYQAHGWKCNSREQVRNYIKHGESRCRSSRLAG